MAIKAATAKKEPSLISKGVNYIKESWAETKRATWPSWLEIRRLTTAVFAGVAFVTIYIYVLDSVFAFVTKELFKHLK